MLFFGIINKQRNEVCAMLILPMKVKGIIVNLQISFKTVKKEENVLLQEHNPNFLGNFEINRIHYFGSDMSKEEQERMEKTLKLHPEILTDFVRRCLETKQDKVIVYSQNYKEKDFCTKYYAPHPPKRGNLALDKLYGKLLNDLRLNTEDKKYHSFLSFEKIGLKEEFMQEKEGIVREGVDVLEYLETLQFTTIDDWHDRTVQNQIQMRPKKFLAIYQEMARQNSKTYIKMNRLHQQIYATQPSWPKLTEQQKIYIKAIDTRKAA